jgi:transcriptional regulator with XRE-family HTH domain
MQQQGFAVQLRGWRRRRGWSQLELSGRTGISQRHLAFLELERASPSRDMVARLATALDLPLRQQNALLLAAGFAPIWRESDLTAPELGAVRDGLNYMLAQQEPYPAVVVDRQWNLLKANDGAVRLIEFLVGPVSADARINLADALVAPDVLRPYLTNWHDVARYFIRSVEADAAADVTGATATLLERLLNYDGVQAALKASTPHVPTTPILPMQFQKGAVTLNLFTTLATLGTPQNITLQELRIENFYPLDDATGATLRDWVR